MTAMWFALAAAGGALIRHRVNLLGRAWLGTLAVNVAGALLLGYLLGSGASGDTVLVVGSAGCGSLTTFSTFALETVEARDLTRLHIVVVMIVSTLAAAAVGYGLA